MKLKVVASSVEFASLVPSSLFNSYCLKKYSGTDRAVSLVLLSTSFVSKNFGKSQSFKNSRSRPARRSCSLNLGEIYHEESPLHVPGLGNYGQTGSQENEGGTNKKAHYTISRRDAVVGRDQDSFSTSRFDFLEPMMLGIRLEFADRPDQETAVWATIEQKAKSLEIPLSLRMIKKKLQCEEGFTEPKESVYCSIKAAFASMVFIIVELQSYALQMREALCNEDLEVIISKVQKEMNSSFVWLFQQVFSRTPSLMLYVMILLANFGVYSASHDVALAKASQSRVAICESTTDALWTEEKQMVLASKSGRDTLVGKAPSTDHELGSVVEMNLWNSIVDEANKMREGIEGEAIGQETKHSFISPLTVELEPDGYEEYLRTDLLYQMNLSYEPDNALLLSNYAQFLHLVAHDYDRAEECYKRAVQIPPPDAECLSLYANFLWTVRRDVWGAEERFLQALAAEPTNSYYASRYANFLWNTGGEETCFPPNKPHNTNL
ncbi:hypothetical protein F511_32505 [Dorcoceras hygrometricum]|uniref:Uncharacterized protein n=1 Tax=Dorcoceras hygrometricum TaxID=472368 RepID=A0A2Z7BTA8_9LAMI|nr:hypothetical protein F511_32505 [Dorcoceras hygrometricum]